MNSDSVTLYIANGCPHCASLLQLMTQRIKQGTIGRLEIINISTRSQVAQELNLRSVPVTRIGPFEFEGALSAAEIDRWIGAGTSAAAIMDYMDEMLSHGKMHKIQVAIQRDPAWLPYLLRLLNRAELPMQARIGIVAIMEGVPNDQITAEIIASLTQTLDGGDPHIQTDALHILSLYDLPEIKTIMEHYLDNGNDEMKEIANEYLGNL